jgi:hypothetical protein
LNHQVHQRKKSQRQDSDFLKKSGCSPFLVNLVPLPFESLRALSNVEGVVQMVVVAVGTAVGGAGVGVQWAGLREPLFPWIKGVGVSVGTGKGESASVALGFG